MCYHDIELLDYEYGKSLFELRVGGIGSIGMGYIVSHHPRIRKRYTP